MVDGLQPDSGIKEKDPGRNGTVGPFDLPALDNVRVSPGSGTELQGRTDRDGFGDGAAEPD